MFSCFDVFGKSDLLWQTNWLRQNIILYHNIQRQIIKKYSFLILHVSSGSFINPIWYSDFPPSGSWNLIIMVHNDLRFNQNFTLWDLIMCSWMWLNTFPRLKISFCELLVSYSERSGWGSVCARAEFKWSLRCSLGNLLVMYHVKEQRLRESKSENEKTLLSQCYSQIHTGNTKKNK